MKNIDNLEIAKKLIFIAATYDKKEKDKLDEVVKKLEYLKTKIDKNEKLSITILGFINDIIDDIKNGRKINLDNTNSDEYLKNYFITKNQIDIYNNLISLNQYREVFDILQSDSKDFQKVKKLINDINNNFIKNLKMLDSKDIASNLLIFTTINRNLPTEAFERIYAIISKFTILKEEKRIISTMSKKYNMFIKNIVSEAIKCFKLKKYNYKFLYYKFKGIELELKENISDASKIGYRSGNPDYEYKKIILNLSKKD